MQIALENIPRTIQLVRGGGSDLEDGTAAAKAAVLPDGPRLVVLDQRCLPERELFLSTTDWRQVIPWIQALAVRGAPAIGIAGAAGVALAATEAAQTCQDMPKFMNKLEEASHQIEEARPTAVNLSWAVRHMCSYARSLASQGMSTHRIAHALADETDELIKADEDMNRRIGRYGAELLPNACSVLTHCNAGSLATAFFGTALGVIYTAAQQGKIRHVFADETRPVCQGSRLTAWELARAGIPVTLICDDMAACVMAQGKVDAVIVGADRIAANGDTANKIGTLGIAVLAHHFNIPFYVAAPTSTIDLNTPDGEHIPIEQRPPHEVIKAPIEGVQVYNPAFDVTPHDLISSIICENGIFKPDEMRQAVM